MYGNCNQTTEEEIDIITRTKNIASINNCSAMLSMYISGLHGADSIHNKKQRMKHLIIENRKHLPHDTDTFKRYVLPLSK